VQDKRILAVGKDADGQPNTAPSALRHEGRNRFQIQGHRGLGRQDLARGRLRRRCLDTHHEIAPFLRTPQQTADPGGRCPLNRLGGDNGRRTDLDPLTIGGDRQLVVGAVRGAIDLVGEPVPTRARVHQIVETVGAGQSEVEIIEIADTRVVVCPPGLGDDVQAIKAGILEIADVLVVNKADLPSAEVTARELKEMLRLRAGSHADVAVLKIDAEDLPAVRLGDPAKLRVGDWVVAIGAPYGLDNTVTSGIVSAKSRALPGDAVVPFIQTDAAVNPGNSGGPLFNLDGEVVGINSQIFSRTGGFQGLAFAIPIDVALRVKNEIQEHGRVAHGRLGVSVQPVDQALAESFGLAGPRGALVGSVQNGSPAGRAGVQPGDVILKYDGRAVERSDALPAMVAATRPGTKAALEVWRNGRVEELEVEVGERGAPKQLADAKGAVGQGKLGVSVRPLTPEERKEAKLDGGVVVESVAGPAAKAGVRPGDVIVAVNRTPITGVEALRELVQKSGKSVALLIQRDDERLFVPVRLG